MLIVKQNTKQVYLSAGRSLSTISHSMPCLRLKKLTGKVCCAAACDMSSQQPACALHLAGSCVRPPAPFLHLVS